MRKLLVLLVLIIGLCKVNAQSSTSNVVSSAGETYKGNSIQIDWTLGELAITKIQNSSLTMSQGFHQPNYFVTSIKDLNKEIGEILIYPIPASDKIEIRLTFEQSRKVKVQLIDLSGRIIWTEDQNGYQISKTKDISNLANGHYYLNFLIDENQYSQTFKIQKIN